MSRGFAFSAAALFLAGCPTGRTTTAGPSVADATLEIGRDGAALRGVAADVDVTYAAHGAQLEARHGDRIAWASPIAGGSPGPLARSSNLVVTLAEGSSTKDGFHGEPGAAVVAVLAATGAPAWRTDFATTEYALATCVAAVPGSGGVVVGGTFAGTLRAGTHVVASAGASDGFLARLDDTGAALWLVRFGGTFADGVAGIAATDARAAFAGTFTTTAEFAGKPLAAFNDKSPLSDVVVGAVDLATGKPVWVTTFGGKADDAVTGLAIDPRGRVAVAGALRGTVHVGGQDLTARGGSDALVAWWNLADGAEGGALQLGGDDLDGASAIAPLAQGGFVVGGYFSGRIELARNEVFVAGGGDDAFLVRLGATTASDPNGLDVTAAWQITGEGREEVLALAPAPGGFIAGIGHTAKAAVGRAALPSPHDPLAGAALVVRAAR